MNYAWEAVLAARKKGFSEGELCFTEADNPSPYLEVSEEDLNLSAPEGERIAINPLYRFGTVFAALLDKNVQEMKETRALFLDICMHYLVELDLREGLSREDYYHQILFREFMQEVYGKGFRKRFSLFQGEEQKRIIRSYLHLLQSGNYLEEYRKVVTFLYQGDFLYESQERPMELLVYLGVKETKEEQEKAAFLRELFLPMQEKVYYFYEHHFGIIGVEETMVMDEMVIF